MNAESLRKSILQWAIEGKLVPQCDDEPEVKQVGCPPVDVPFTIPGKWKWVYANNVQVLVRGITFPASAKSKDHIEGAVRCLTTGSVQEEYNPFSDVFVSKEYVKKSKQYLTEGDVVLSSANSRELVGKSIFWKKSTNEETFGGFLTVIRVVDDKVLLREYIFLVYQYLFRTRFFAELSTQTTNIANLSNKTLNSLVIPIPPIEEQRRIVQKLNELLPLVEVYRIEQEALLRLEKELPGKLRASILQEAIQGKLVLQIDEEPTVEQIGVPPEDVPFAIPEKWKWILASNVQLLVRGITFPSSAKNKEYVENTIRCLTTGSIQEEYKPSSDVFVGDEYVKKTRQYLVNGDIVLSSANSKELVGKNILWKKTTGEYTFGGFLTVVRVLDSKILLSEYLFLVYQYFFRTGFFAELSTQTTNIANISNKLLSSLLIPVPPIEEQRRIVQKFTDLLGDIAKLSK